MKTLKENFGRRMALIWGGIIAVLISLVMVAAFSTQAKAADPNRAATDPFNADQNYITALVHAGADDVFNVTFNYTVDKVSFGGSSETADLAKMPALAIPGLNLNVAAGGVVTTSTPGGIVTADDPAIYRREGDGSLIGTAPGPDVVLAENGEDGGPWWKWETGALKAYFIQLPFSAVVGATGVSWTIPGEYKYRIHGETSNNNKIAPSQADYDLRIFVVDNSGTMTVSGYILHQSAHDDATTMDLDKKDPRKGYGSSNHLEDYEGTGTATQYYYGFTYSHIVSAEPQNFYVQKIVDNANPDLTVYFPMKLDFYNYGWTEASHTATIVGVVCEVAYASINSDSPPSADLTPLEAVTFTWSTAAGAFEGTFSLRHSQRIIFDGVTAFGGTTSTKIPALTAYTCLEDLETAQTPPVDYSKYTAKAKAYTQAATTAGGTSQMYLGVTPAEDTKGAGKNMFVTYFSDEANWQANAEAYISYKDGAAQVNKAIITNIYNYTPSNFWIDMLPYVVMIGIPIAAFIIWMLARRKKLNR